MSIRRSLLMKRGGAVVNDSFELEIVTTLSPETITLPLTSGATYNFTANWGDGEPDSDITSGTDTDRIHEYTTAGTYLITMSGTLTEFIIDDGAFRLYPLRVLNLGNTGFTRIDFYGCNNLTSIDCGDYDTSSITNFASFGRECSFLTEVLNAENLITSTCTTTSRMFQAAVILLTIDTSSWDLSNVTVMNSMFNDCFVLVPVGLENWNTLNSTNMGEILRDTRAITSLDLSAWEAPSGTLGSALRGMINLTSLDVSTWNISGVTSLISFLNGATIQTSDYDALLVGWTGWSGGAATKTVPSSLDAHFGGAKYTLGSDAADARAWLIATKLWIITDGGGV